MKRFTALTAAMVLVFGLMGAAAQPIGSRGLTMQVLIGVVKTVTPSTFTVLAGNKTSVFAWDSKTRVGIAGGAPKTVPSIAELVHVGDQVTVKSRDVKGTMLATDIDVRPGNEPAKR